MIEKENAFPLGASAPPLPHTHKKERKKRKEKKNKEKEGYRRRIL